MFQLAQDDEENESDLEDPEDYDKVHFQSSLSLATESTISQPISYPASSSFSSSFGLHRAFSTTCFSENDMASIGNKTVDHWRSQPEHN